jgi:hypothetical protein
MPVSEPVPEEKLPINRATLPLNFDRAVSVSSAAPKRPNIISGMFNLPTNIDKANYIDTLPPEYRKQFMEALGGEHMADVEPKDNSPAQDESKKKGDLGAHEEHLDAMGLLLSGILKFPSAPTQHNENSSGSSAATSVGPSHAGLYADVSRSQAISQSQGPRIEPAATSLSDLLGPSEPEHEAGTSEDEHEVDHPEQAPPVQDLSGVASLHDAPKPSGRSTQQPTLWQRIKSGASSAWSSVKGFFGFGQKKLSRR